MKDEYEKSRNEYLHELMLDHQLETNPTIDY